MFRDEYYGTDLEVIDMSGCKQMRQLVLSDFVAEQLIWDTGRLGPCPLTFELQNGFDPFAEHHPEALLRQAAVAQQVYLDSHKGTDGYKQGMLAAFTQMKLLVLDWPPGFEPAWADEDDFREEAGGYLSWCMPSDGRPLQRLETIII